MLIVPPISHIKHPHLIHAINNVSNKKEKYLILNNLKKFYNGIIDTEVLYLGGNRPDGVCKWNAHDTNCHYDSAAKPILINCNILRFGKKPNVWTPMDVDAEMFNLKQLAWLKYIDMHFLNPLGHHLEMMDKTVCYDSTRYSISFIRIENNLICATYNNKVILREFVFDYDLKQKLERTNAERLKKLDQFQEDEEDKDDLEKNYTKDTRSKNRLLDFIEKK